MTFLTRSKLDFAEDVLIQSDDLGSFGPWLRACTYSGPYDESHGFLCHASSEIGYNFGGTGEIPSFYSLEFPTRSKEVRAEDLMGTRSGLVY